MDISRFSESAGELHCVARKSLVNCLRGEFAHLSGVDGFGAAVRAVAAGEDFGLRGLHLFVYTDAAFFVRCDTGDGFEE